MRSWMLGALALTGLACGPIPSLPAAQMPFANGVEGLAYKAIGGAAYGSFRIRPQLPRGRDRRAAVKLTYLMNDDTAHQSPWSLKMLQMLDNLPQARVHNVVFRDGSEMGDSRLYYIEQADTSLQTVKNPQSPLVPGVGEVQSNNPKVFSEIVSWAFDTYPATRRYLQLYTHGAGVMGVGTDEKQTDPSGKLLPEDQQIWAMPVRQFAESLRQALRGRPLDAIYFRACLMGNVEALYELRGVVRYALASEDVSYSVENSNITMTKLFDDLAARDMEPAELVQQMAIAANAKSVQTRNGNHSGYTTIAAIDLSRIDEFKSALNTWALTLRRALPTQKAAILAAYDAVPPFNGEEKASSYFLQSRDIWALTAHVLQRVPDPAIQRATQALRDAQRKLMLHERDSFGSAANGLSVFMPTRDEEGRKLWQTFGQNGYAKLRFAHDSAWNEFLTDVMKASSP